MTALVFSVYWHIRPDGHETHSEWRQQARDSLLATTKWQIEVMDIISNHCRLVLARN